MTVGSVSSAGLNVVLSSNELYEVWQRLALRDENGKKGDESLSAENDLVPADGSSPPDSVESPRQLLSSSLQTALLRGRSPTLRSASTEASTHDELKTHLAALVDAAQPVHLKEPSCAISAQHYYPVWCVLLCTVAGAAHGVSFDAETGAEDPKSGLYSLPVLAALLGQAGDGKITFDGARAALAGKEQTLEDCRVYLTAVSGLQALEKLKKAEAEPAGLKLIEDAQKTLQALADARKATFLSSLNLEYLVPRCELAWWRDVIFGSASLAKIVPTTAVCILSASGPLAGAAKHLATTLPYLSGGITMVTGVLHILQAIFEGKDARNIREALRQAEQFDKQLFLDLIERGVDADGVVGQHLLDLLAHRSRNRGLRDLVDVDLTEAHSWVRGIYGGISLGSAVTTTVLTALGTAALMGAASMGIFGLVSVALAGAYMLWYGIRANIGTEAQKTHDKACRTAEAVHARQADSMPGLTSKHHGRPLQAIARSMVAQLRQEPTQKQTIEVLQAMDISSSAIDAAIRATKGENDQALIELIVQWGAQTTSGSEKESLRRFYARSDVPASDKLMALERWEALGNEPKDIGQKPKEGPAWVRHLAQGAHMGDLCRSSLTPSLIEKHWHEKGLQASLGRMLRHEGAGMFADAMASATTEKEKQDIAWQGLQALRFERQQKAKVRATVADWVRDGLWGNLQLSLKDDPVTLGHRRVLVEEYGISAKKDPQNIPDILAALQQHALKQPLQTDTLPSFMAICKASEGDPKSQLADKVQVLVNDTIRSMGGTVGDQEVWAALGLKSPGHIDAHNVDAVLPVLQQFLTLSEKLRAQTLPKVVASLHTYATGGFPPALCRIAALRELRLRCEKPDGLPPDLQNMQRALVLIEPMLKQKLHTRTLGAGQGGGVFGFFGYTLNGKGKFIEYLVKTCQGGKPAPVALSRAELQQLFGLSDDSAYRNALRHFTGAPTTEADRFAEAYALQHTPGDLEKALKRRDANEARDSLITQLGAARQRVETSFQTVNTGDTVALMKKYFDLEALAMRHKVKVVPLALGIEDEKLQFYRAALTWPNKTALAKNIRAMQTELEQLKQGQPQTGNPFWSAKFLASQGAAVSNDAWRRMRALHPEILAKAYTYKAQVQTLRAWNRMGLDTVWQAIQKKDAPKARHWLQLQFKEWGLPPPVDLDRLLAQLKTAKTTHELTIKLLELKADARSHHAGTLAATLYQRHPLTRPSLGEGSNRSTNDTFQSGPPIPVSNPSVPALTI